MSLAHALAADVLEPVRPVVTDGEGRFELNAPAGLGAVSGSAQVELAAGSGWSGSSPGSGGLARVGSARGGRRGEPAPGCRVARARRSGVGAGRARARGGREVPEGAGAPAADVRVLELRTVTYETGDGRVEEA